MSCGCRQDSCLVCRAEYPAPIVQRESLPSQIENLSNALFGIISKSVVGGRVVWAPACSASSDVTINGVARLPDEGLLCYLLRALASTTPSAGMLTINGQNGGVVVPITQTYVNLYLLNCAGSQSLTVNLPPIGGAPYSNRQLELLVTSLGAGVTLVPAAGDLIQTPAGSVASISALVTGESFGLTAGNPSGGVGVWYQF